MNSLFSTGSARFLRRSTEQGSARAFRELAAAGHGHVDQASPAGRSKHQVDAEVAEGAGRKRASAPLRS